MREPGCVQARQRRRALLRSAGLAALQAAGTAWAAQPPGRSAGAWPAWEAFRERFVSDSGRVSANEQGQTHSEAQAYAMLFALTANDRERFGALVRWTEDNLCAGDLTARLPAWLWGQREDGSWGVVDDNAASDADLWIAYALAEAGRLWRDGRYQALAATLAARIVREETAELPGLGRTLLPGPKGFDLGEGRWRLNPSYLPLQVLHGLERATGQQVWRGLARTALRVLVESAPRGFSPDWVVHDAARGLVADTETGGRRLGGYNAIRVYLWAGTLHPAAAGRAALLKALRPMADWVREHGHPPASVDSATAQASGAAPAGFSAALLPFLQASGAGEALRLQQLRLQARAPRPHAYYEQCLALFGDGFIAGAYRFDVDGRLLPRWKERS